MSPLNRAKTPRPLPGSPTYIYRFLKKRPAVYFDMPPAGIPTLDLIGSIYDAVADARRWPAFLESFVHAVGGARGSLALLDPGMRAPDIVCWYGWPENELRDYAERYAATDPFTAPSAQLQEGEVATSNEICTPAQLEQSLTYREFYCRCSAAHGIGGAILRTSKTTSAIFAQRGKERGPFGSAEKAIIRPLLPHLKRAAMLHGELTSLRSQLATFTAHLEQYPHALLLSDSDEI